MFFILFSFLASSLLHRRWKDDEPRFPRPACWKRNQRLTSLGPGGHTFGWNIMDRVVICGAGAVTPSEPCATNLQSGGSRPRQSCLKGLGVFASGGRVGHHQIFNFLFAHSPTQLHQLSLSHLVSREMGSIPSFFMVWTTVQANLGVGKQLWIRINSGQASHRHSPLMLQKKAWDALTLLCIKHFFWLSTLRERARSSK